MHDLTPITALGGSAPRVDTAGQVTCTEVTDLALASVAARQGQEKAAAKALKKLLKGDAPDVGKALLSEPYSAVWVGPDQWMIGAGFADHETLADEVSTAVASSASVTEQTDAWCCFDLTGTGLQAVLELLCNVNARGLQSGDAVRTSIHHLACFLVCGDPDGFVRILGPRASAGSLHHAIVAAMHSVA